MLRGNESVFAMQTYLNDIYRMANGEFAIEAILARMLEALSEATSPFETVDLHSTFVKALSWYFAFCNRVDINAQICAVRRYPRSCPLCVEDTCVCERTQRLPMRASYLSVGREQTLQMRADRLLMAPDGSRRRAPSFDLNWFSSMFSDIYPVNRARWRVNRFYFPAKLLREAGKMANGFRKYRNAGSSEIRDGAKRHLENDSSDFFAWLIGYWSLAALETDDDDLQGRFVERYKSGCPYCHQLPCACPREKRLGNRAEFVSFNLLNESPDLARELEQRIAEIKKALEPHPELKELESELENKAKSVSGAMDVLWKIAEKAEKLDRATGGAENIARRVSGAIEWIERTFSFFQGSSN